MRFSASPFPCQRCPLLSPLSYICPSPSFQRPALAPAPSRVSDDHGGRGDGPERGRSSTTRWQFPPHPRPFVSTCPHASDAPILALCRLPSPPVASLSFRPPLDPTPPCTLGTFSLRDLLKPLSSRRRALARSARGAVSAKRGAWCTSHLASSGWGQTRPPDSFPIYPPNLPPPPLAFHPAFPLVSSPMAKRCVFRNVYSLAFVRLRLQTPLPALMPPPARRASPALPMSRHVARESALRFLRFASFKVHSFDKNQSVPSASVRDVVLMVSRVTSPAPPHSVRSPHLSTLLLPLPSSTAPPGPRAAALRFCPSRPPCRRLALLPQLRCRLRTTHRPRFGATSGRPTACASRQSRSAPISIAPSLPRFPYPPLFCSVLIYFFLSARPFSLSFLLSRSLPLPTRWRCCTMTVLPFGYLLLHSHFPPRLPCVSPRLVRAPPLHYSSVP